MILWADIESTGLEERQDALLEVALLATTDHLDPLDEGVSVVIGNDPALVSGMMDSNVREMHTRSGLIDEVGESEYTVAAAEAVLLGYLERFDQDELKRSVLAGSNVKFDRKWLSFWMPRVHDSVHYRDICVSSTKELTRRFWPEVYANAPEKNYAHRAWDDIGESIDELRYCLEQLGAPALQTVL